MSVGIGTDTDFIGDFYNHIAKFGRRNLTKGFPLATELFVNFNGSLLHDGMGLMTSADEDEVFPAGQSGFAVGIVEPNAQQSPLFPRCRFVRSHWSFRSSFPSCIIAHL